MICKAKNDVNGYLYLVVVDGVSLKIGMTCSSNPDGRIRKAIEGLCLRFNHSQNHVATHVYVKEIKRIDDITPNRVIVKQESAIKNELAKVCKTQKRKSPSHYPESYKTKTLEWMTDAKIKYVERIAVENGFSNITNMYSC